MQILNVNDNQESQHSQLLTPNIYFKREKQTKPKPMVSYSIKGCGQLLII